jgi:YegS/Rv2252/BmrU family lipid kinase
VESTVQFIINGNAGEVVTEEAREAARALIAAAFPGAEIHFTEEGTNVTELARLAVERGSRMVVAGGGDGTINAVASALVGTDSVLGVIALGTLNHFAKDLGLPQDLEGGLSVLTGGTVKAIDVGEVNRRIFVNNSGLGLYPTIVRLRETKQKEGVGKWPAAVWATLKALARYRVLTVTVSLDGRELSRRTPIVFVGNGEYQMQGMRNGQRERLDDGQLCLYIPHPQTRSALLRLSIRALIGKSGPDEDLDLLLAREFTISSRHRHLAISLDGEVRELTTPLLYRVRPRALRVMVASPA